MQTTFSNRSFAERAFSLVELSIVLVILGLLVGGVLSGRSLIRASELRSITVDRDKFASAIFTFRDKYFQLPGDLSNAYQFWGATCGADTTAPSTGCNGNGDGFISLDGGEAVKAWEHLALSGLISGSYDATGTILTVTQVQLSGANSPPSKFQKLYWGLNSDSTVTSFAATDAPWNNAAVLSLQVGSINTITATSHIFPQSGSFSREDAWTVDKKMDDGKSASGKVRGYDLFCNDTGSDYGLPTDAAPIGQYRRCWLFFILQ